MRHLRRLPLQIPLLTRCVQRPAALRRLVPPPGPAQALPSTCRAAGFSAVDLPPVAAPAQHHLPATPPALEESMGLAEGDVVSGLDNLAETGEHDSGRRAR